VPDFLGTGKLVDKGEGFKWQNKHAEFMVRIRKGNPNLDYPAQQVDYVKITSGGRVLDTNGTPVDNSAVPEAHIPLSEWLKWEAWNKK
jgi:hypothetical protein